MKGQGRVVALGLSLAIMVAAVAVVVIKLSSGGSAKSAALTLPPVPTFPADAASARPPSPHRASRQRQAWIDVGRLRQAVAQIGGGQVGVALLPLGDGAPVTAGALQVGAGWSTMKVPVIMARYQLAENSGEPVSDLTDRVRRAVTASDNSAILSLFGDLEGRDGGLVPASLAVQQVLRSAGDQQTIVNTRQPPGGFSTFGQTQWSLSAGDQFYRALADGCIRPSDGAQQVLDLMTQVIPSQRWGFGQANFHGATTYFKGGWGPDPGGAYLVRQFGVVVAANNHGYVAGVMAKPDDGSFQSGIDLVDRLTDAISQTTSAGSAPPTAPC